MMRSDEIEQRTGASAGEVADPQTEVSADAARQGDGAPGGATQQERDEASANAGVAGADDGAVARELEAVRDRYLRLAAEYENFRKRTERERSESRDRAQAQLLEGLLEPLDDLQRVAQLKADGTTAQAVLEGVQMVERKFFRALEAAGLELLNARGEPFDPTVHEALMMAPTEEISEDGTVGEVFQPGYRFRGLLLRPARVQVRRHGG